MMMYELLPYFKNFTIKYKSTLNLLYELFPYYKKLTKNINQHEM